MNTNQSFVLQMNSNIHLLISNDFFHDLVAILMSSEL